MKNLVKGLAVFTAVALLIGLGLLVTPPPRLVDKAALRARAGTYAADITRDTLGVPHVHGARDADAAFGLAYAHAQDDWKTIETMLLASRGDLARYQGMAGARTDYLVNLFRIRTLVAQKYETDLSPQTRALLEGYAAGLNLYALDHPKAVRPGVLPVRPQDVVAGFVFRAPFFYGLDADLAELFKSERARHISLADSKTAFLTRRAANPEFGSNAFAVAPSRSADQTTRLVINSHQPYSGPVAWYEIQVSSDEGWNAAGGIFPGTPVILHGFNANLGWAHTVNKPDLADIYVLNINPENKNQYWFDGGWRDFERTKAPLRIKLWGPFSLRISKEVLWSVHGPVLRRPHGVYALRFSGLFEIRAVQQWYRMNKAQNFAQWRAAMAMNAIPSLNVIYGDKEGNIGYFYNARMPNRGQGYDWRAYLPGDTSAALWRGFLPVSALPKVINPASGFVINSNNTPFRSSAPDDNPDPADFSPRLGIEHYMTNRSLRALALMQADTSIDEGELEAIKFDLSYSGQSQTARLLREIAALDSTDNALLAKAQALLAGWNLRTEMGNKATALGVLVSIKCIGLDTHAGDPWMMEPKAAVLASARDLVDHYGRLDVPWGTINRLRRGNVDVPIAGGPDILRAVYSAGHDLEGDGTLSAVAGDTYIAIVSWDADGKMQARTRHQFGSATLDKTSPHYADQAAAFAAQTLRVFPFSKEALAGQTESVTHIGGVQ